ncbi:arrestin domain-containing protein 2-like [Oppia nitens]|uniref:arrestin domain-containing protein 2-like n=1 Tax=Oppia nitens TaxID=1686743 RepID=UPI0023DAB931|nr:arrestin domain-containing protein 2-like [Oppia nitens]
MRAVSCQQNFKKMSKSMPIIKHFSIELDKSQHIYRAGDAVKGKCYLNIEGNIQFKHIDINLIFEAFVDCKQTKFDKQSMYELIDKYDLLKKSATDQTLEGLVEIDFYFTIPEKGCVSSFYGKFGFIRYKIEVIIHKDWDIFRKEVFLTVIAPYNGNVDDVYTPISTMIRKKIGIFNNFIEVFAKLDNGWITPGDKISVYCNVDNNSDHNLKLSLSLQQKQNYFYTKIKSKISNDNMYDIIEAKSHSYSKRILLGIPSNLKTMSLDCNILKINYQIRVLIEIEDSKELLKVELPIVLTIPTKSDSNKIYETHSLPPSYSDCHIFEPFVDQNIQFLNKTVVLADDNKYNDCSAYSPNFVDLPPTYTEAIFGIK